ncbi:LamG-like jellyroll fold domain-containing protein [Kitasatospora sp. NPDC051914]|uniref:LamG-like jellyroll fold domain-containing protein n=1 Tax=Kitasatospora sp. NPDC051914 TaxID=3154945 RepID=UPI003447B70E
MEGRAALGGALPKQQTGTASGKRHDASAADTRAGGGAGHAPGKGHGELAAYEPHAAKVPQGLSATVTGFDAKASKRRADKSTSTSDYFENPDGSHTRRLYPAPVNFQEAQGNWQKTDSTLTKAASGRWQQKAAAQGADFAANANDPALARLALDGGRSLSFAMQGAADSTAQASGADAVYPAVAPDTDLKLTASPAGVKESIVLRSAKAATTWTFPLDLQGLTAHLTDAGSVELRAADGTVAAVIPHGYAFDSKIDPRSADPATTHNVTYRLQTTGGRTSLVVSLDGAWLHAPERVFPVTVDPTTFTSQAVSTYAQSGVPEGDHSTEQEIKIGSYDAGPHSATSYLAFPKLGLDNSSATVSSAQLNLRVTYASSCTPQTFNVAAVNTAWTPAGVTGYPGPAYGASIATGKPASVTNACANTAGDPAVGDDFTVSLPAATLNSWATGASPDYGLALYAPNTDTLHYMKFGSMYNPRAFPSLTITYSNMLQPQVLIQTPVNGFAANTLTPLLSATAQLDPGMIPPPTPKFAFQVYNESGTKIAESGLITGDVSTSAGNWTVPAGKLVWGQTYYWTVQAYDGIGYSPNPVWNALTTQVPQPQIISGLSQNTDDHGLSPSIGNYTTTATDADISSPGPSLSIERDYNSRDPRTTGGFGAGWSSIVDAKLTEQPDASGAMTSVVVTYPDGSAVGFGKNSDNTFSPPQGRFATLRTVTGGYSLTDKNATVYTFTQSLGTGAYGLTSVADANGRALNLTWTSGTVTKLTSSASGRTLTLTWAKPAGALATHVATVTTDPEVLGDASTARVWTYGYTGDQLTRVCSPISTTACTTYAYAGASQYRNLVLDQDASSLWPLSEASGTVAASAVLTQQGADNGTYRDVTLGQPGPLAGSTATAAGFNGTSSQVKLPRLGIGASSAQTISLWFKTTTRNGVLFSYSDDPIKPSVDLGNFVPALYVDSAGRLNGIFWTNNEAPTPITTPSNQLVDDGNWHHVVLSGSWNNQRMWLDGQKVGADAPGFGTAGYTVANAWAFNQVYLGTGYLSAEWPNHPTVATGKQIAAYFNGSIAQAAWYDKPLQQADVTALYQTGKNPAQLLNKVSRASGKTFADITYDPATAAVTKLTDENGGNWTPAVPTITGSSQVYRSAVMGASPANYYRLGEAAGAASAVNEINSGAATYSGVTLGDAGPFGDTTAATFNGTSSYLQLPSSVQLTTGPNSAEMWFKMNAGSTAGGVLFGYQGSPLTSPTQTSWVPALYVGTDGKLRGKFWNLPQVTGPPKVNDGKWHHVVLAASSSAQTLYLDGAAVGSSTGAMSAPASQGYVYVGAGNATGWSNAPTSPGGYFPGSIAEVAFYRTQLSSAQAGAHYTAGKNSNGLNPVQRIAVTEPGGGTIGYEYDVHNGNRMIAQTTALGERTTYGYDTSGFLRTVTDPIGNVTTTGHDVRGNVVSKTTCQNQAAQKCSTSYFTFLPDATTVKLSPSPLNDLPATMRDGRSANADDPTYVTSYGYDANGNQTGVTTPPVAGFPSGRTTTVAYTDGTTVAAADGGFAPKGLPYRTTSPGGAVTAVSYYKNGDIASVTTPTGMVTRFEYDNLGQILKKTVVSDSFPAGLATTFTYNKAGQQETRTDPPTTNRVTGAVHTAKTTTTFDADGLTLSQTVSDLTGGDAPRVVSNTYNQYAQLETSTDAVGRMTTLRYDARGMRSSETAADGTTTDTAYDALGRVTAQTLKDYAGDPTHAAGDLVLSSRSYDPAGRLSKLYDASGNITQYTYTDNGLTATVTRTDPTGAHSFVLQNNTYDAAGNLVQQAANNGATTTRTGFDAANRATTSTVDPAGVNRTTTISYTPDDHVAIERLTDATGSTRTTSHTYDAMGQETSTSIQDDTVGRPVTWWTLDQPSGTAVSDATGNGNTAATAAGVTWGNGAAGFNNTAGQTVTSTGPVLNTATSYTVSAWANLADTNSFHTIVAQSGNAHGSFFLQYSKALNAWTFIAPSGDSTTGVTYASATATGAPATNTWTHLVGVFDSATGSMKLYINGSLAATGTNPSPWSGNGPLAVGNIKLANGGFLAGNTFSGQIANVQAYQRPLTDTDIATLYTAGRGGGTVAGTTRQAAAAWKLDQTSGTTVADTTANNYTATAAGGVTWGNSAAGFNNAAGQTISTTGPVVNPTASYTVSAWANLADTNAYHTVLAQTGANHGTFFLQYSKGLNGWTFISPSADSTTGITYASATSPTPPATNTWTHLVGVFDSTNKSMKLYVNGSLAATTTNNSPWSGSGPLSIGNVKLAGGGFMAGNTFSGQIANVQAYRSALSAGDVGNLYNAGRTSGVTAAAPLSTVSWKLDQRGLPLSMTDPAGNTTTYVYDEAGHQVLTSRPTVNAEVGGGAPVAVHPVTTVGYDTFGSPTETQDPNGNTVTTAYDAAARPVSQKLPNYTKPDGSGTITDAVATTEYDAAGHVAKRTDPLGRTTSYTYTQLGDLAETTDPAGGKTTTVYDASGRPQSVTTRGGAQAFTTYDWLGRKITSSVRDRYPTPTTSTTTYSYAPSATNPGGAFLASTTSQLGVTASSAYNNVGEVLSSTDPAGNVTQYTYDVEGRTTAVRAPDGTWSKAVFDGLGNLAETRRLDTDGTTVLSRTSATYDAMGRVLSSTDPNNHTTRFTYDATGALITQVEPVTDTTSITTSYGYDAAGQRTRFTDGRGNQWIYGYNAWNLPETTLEPAVSTAAYSYTSAADRTTTTVYDKAGRAALAIAPGGVRQQIGYDDLDRVTSQSGSGAEADTATRSFDYDADGRVTGARTDAIGTTTAATGETFTYNDRGALLTATGSAGDSSFAYNADGQPTSRTDAAGTATYTYSAGRLDTASDPLTNTVLQYTYNSLSQPAGIAYGAGGNTRTFNYDRLHRLTADTLKTPGGVTIAAIGYGYDPAGNTTSKTTQGFAGATTNTYTYDHANRLTSWNNGTATTAYEYDASGNRIRSGANVYTYDARNQLTGDGVTTYTYSARGTLTNTRVGQTDTTNASDAFGQQVLQGDQRYTMDALGRVITDQGTSSTRTFAYSGADNLVAYDGANTYSRGAGGELLATSTPGASAGSGVLAFTDRHDDVVGNFTATGTALTASTAYDPLGSVLTGTVTGQLGYQSGWTEKSTGRVNMAARWYNPGAGQFMNKDTWSLSPNPDSVAANPFAYANGDPIANTDPSGHGIWGSIKSWGAKALSAVSRGWHTVTNTVQAATSWVVDKANSAVDWVVDTYHSAVNSFTRDLERLTRQLREATKRLNDAYNRIKRLAATYTAPLRKAAGVVAKGTQQLASTTWNAVKDAPAATLNYVKAHAATIASFAVSTLVFVGCEAVVTAATGGAGAVPGAIACGALAGAAAGLVDQGAKCLGGQQGACSLNAFATSAVVGAVGGAIGGWAGGAIGGKLAQTALGKILPKLVTRTLEEAAVGGISGGASGAVNYGLSCSDNATGCSWSGALQATASGTVDGAVGGAMGGALSHAGSRAREIAGPGTGRHRATGEGGASSSCPTTPDPHSFTGETPVLMADGTTKPIDQIKTGDEITNAVPGKEGTETHTVTDVIVTTTDHDFVDLTVAPVTEAETTPQAVPNTGGAFRKALLGLAAGAAALTLWAGGSVQPAQAAEGPTAAPAVSTTDAHTGEATLTTTYHHPFYDQTQHAFVEAKDLHPGDILQSTAGDVRVVTVRLYHADATTYDLTIGDLHTYYVAAGDTSVLVHNINPPVAGACAVTGGPYRGGQYKDQHAKQGVIERNHMPASQSIQDAWGMPEGQGLTIQMDIADHKQTQSWGSSRAGQLHRAHQTYLLRQGRLTEALQMDIDNVKSMFPGKYDSAIDEMLTKLPEFIEAANRAGFNRPIR